MIRVVLLILVGGLGASCAATAAPSVAPTTAQAPGASESVSTGPSDPASAAGGPASPRPSAAPDATSAAAHLQVVGLGDSYMSAQNTNGQSFMDLYAAELENRLGRAVDLTVVAPGDETTAKLKESLTSDETVRHAVANADVVVISVGGNDSDPFAVYPKGTCAPKQPLPSCLEAYSPMLAGNYDAILTLIGLLRDGKPTAVRVTSMDDPFVGWPEAPTKTFAKEFFAQVAEAQTQAVFAIAKGHGARTVDYLHVFSGPDGLRDAAPYLAADHAHPGELGIQTIAGLLLDLGTPELN